MAVETINANIDAIQYTEGLVPATPAATKWRTYFKTDGYYYIDDAANEIGPLTGAGAVAAVDKLQYTTGLAAPAYAEGLTFWDDVNGTLAWHTDITDVTVQGGQEVQIRVRNVSGAQIDNGEVVYISGASGGLPKVDLAKADAFATSLVLAMATADIANGTDGKVTAFGTVNDLDTSGFVAGDELFLSATTAGAVTATSPVAPNFKIPIGVVKTSHVSTGNVHFTHGTAVTSTSLADINETAPTDGQILQWDNANSYYIPADAGRLELIGEVVLGAPAATMGISSIPATYRGLVGITSARSFAAATDIFVTFNSVGTNTYYSQYLRVAGASPTAAEVLAATAISMVWASATSSSIANSFSDSTFEVNHYTASSKNRTLRYTTIYPNNAGSGGTGIVTGGGWWNGTTVINSITLTPSAGNFDTGSSFALYGVL